MKTAIIYVRVSDKKQAKKELPLESQMYECRRAAEELDAKIVAEFSEPGRSAFHDKRIAFEKAIKYCEEHLPNYFITWDTERFSRRVSIGYTSEERLEKVGTEIIYAGFDAGDDPDSRFLNVGVRRLMGELQSRSNSKSTKRSMILNARNGFFNGGITPFGLEARPCVDNKKKKRLHIVPHQAEIVRKIFKMRLEGAGGKSIAIYLNDCGYDNRGRRWSKKMIVDLLRNHAMCGFQVYGRVDSRTTRIRPKEDWIIVKAHEAIVSEEQFNKVQKLMDAQTVHMGRGSPLSNFLFTGLLQCDKCGGSMQIQTATGKKKKLYSYYNCRNAVQNGTCSNRRLSAPKLDDYLSDEILSKLLSDHNLIRLLNQAKKAEKNWVDNTENRERDIRKRLQSLEKKNANILEIMEDRGIESDTKILLERVNKNEREIQSLESDLLEIKHTNVQSIDFTGVDIQGIREYLTRLIKSESSVKKARACLSSIIQRIVVKDEEVIVYYRPGNIISGGFQGSSVAIGGGFAASDLGDAIP